MIAFSHRLICGGGRGGGKVVCLLQVGNIRILIAKVPIVCYFFYLRVVKYFRCFIIVGLE